MTTIRASLAKWALPLLGIYLILIGIATLFGVAVPAIILGILALVVGVLLLLST